MSPLYRGKHHRVRVTICRRCGRRAYNLSKKQCSACGFGESPKIRKYNWQTKSENRNHRLR